MLAGHLRGLCAAAAIGCLLAAPRPAHALDPARRLTDYALDRWRLGDGLPQESITAVVQTRDGYLWLGTLDGLVRFDGVRFEVINLIHRAGMEGNVVLALAEGPDGSLWIGTRAGLARFSGDRFTTWGTEHGLADTLIRSLTFDRKGVLWIGTRAGGLCRFDGRSMRVLTTANGLADNDVRGAAEGPDGALWVATSRGLARVRDGTVEPVPVPGGAQSQLALSLCRDRRGTVWIGTADGLFQAPAGLDGISPSTRLLAGRQVRTLVEDADGSVWAGTTTGLARVSAGRVEAIAKSEGLPHGDVRSLAVDREGSLWVGTDGGGLGRLRNASVVMVRSKAGPDSNVLMAVYQDAAGTMWGAANCGGLIRNIGPEATAYTTRHGLPDNCVRALAETPDHAVWAGTVGGLARIDRGGVTAFTTRDGLPSNQIMTLLAGRDATLWIGTIDAGLARFSAGRFTSIGTADGLPNPDIRALAEGPDGSLWIGTFGGGLCRLKGGRLTTFTRRDGLSNNNVLALLADADGTLWIGTNGGGLTRMRDGAFTRITTAEGLYSDGVFQVLDGGDGHVWMGGNRGIFRVSRQEVEALATGSRRGVTSWSLTAADGLRTGGVMGGAQPAGWRDSSGRLWFPTIDGAAVVDPARLAGNPVAPLLSIRRIGVDRREWPMAEANRLPAGSREIEIDYSALSFVRPSQVLFRYRLEGFDPTWVDAGTRRSAYFTNLRPGRYRFSVTACNDHGVWNRTGASFAFEILPRYYQTGWFLAIVAGAVLASGWGVFRFRVRQLRAHERQLARQVEQSLAEIKILKGLLPICASCKRIRDDAGDWRQIEAYIHQHSQAKFSHGICPECMAKLYPDYAPGPDAGA